MYKYKIFLGNSEIWFRCIDHDIVQIYNRDTGYGNLHSKKEAREIYRYYRSLGYKRFYD